MARGIFTGKANRNGRQQAYLILLISAETRRSIDIMSTRCLTTHTTDKVQQLSNGVQIYDGSGIPLGHARLQ